MTEEKHTDGDVEIEVERPKMETWEDLETTPLIKTSDKTNKIAGIVILVLAVLGLGVMIYLQVAHATGTWPF